MTCQQDYMPIWVSKSLFGLLQSNPRLKISHNIRLNALNLKMPDCPISFVFFLKILCILKIESVKGNGLGKL